MTEIHGFCDERFEPLRQAFVTNFEEGLELGASLAVAHHGKMVVDLWGGHADLERTRPWQTDTIVNVFSTTKIMTTVCALMLMDQGLLDIEAPVKTYWPEMSGNGKDKLTTKHIFLHAAGLPGFAKRQPFETMFDWQRMIQLLEQEPLWFEPGSMQAYHGLTYGWLLGEIVRRISGETPAIYFRHHIAEPLSLDIHMGQLPTGALERVGQLYFDGTRETEDLSEMQARINASFGGPPDWSSARFLAAEMPAAKGIGNARAVARFGAALAMGGELDEVHLMSRETRDFAIMEHSREYDAYVGEVIARGLGVGLASESIPEMWQTMFGWGGYGGSVCMMDIRHEASLGYAPNRLTTEVGVGDRAAHLLDALRSVVESIDD